MRKLVLLLLLLTLAAPAGADPFFDPADDGMPRDVNARVHTCLDFEYTLDEDGNATLTRWNGVYRAWDGGENEVEVPDALEEHPVTAIGYGTFAERSPGRVVIPEGITAIGPRAFQDAWVTEIEIPSTVTSIGHSAFQECEGLTRLEIPEGVQEIGERLCMGCEDLREVSLPGSLQEVPEEAFRGCIRLGKASLGEGIRAIGRYAFYGCEQLETLYLPATLQSFEQHDAWWTTLTGFDLAPGSPFFRVEDGMLLSADGTLLLAWPGQSTLTACAIPEGVVSVEDCAFFHAEHLEEVAFPSTLVEIGKSAFRSCGALKRAMLPEGVVFIGDYAFYDCPSLGEVVLPGSLWEIGEDAFREERTEPVPDSRSPRAYDAPPGSFAYQWLVNHSILPLTPDAG